MTAYLFIATVFLVLLVFWRFLNWTFDLIEKARADKGPYTFDNFITGEHREFRTFNQLLAFLSKPPGTTARTRKRREER